MREQKKQTAEQTSVHYRNFSQLLRAGAKCSANKVSFADYSECKQKKLGQNVCNKQKRSKTDCSNKRLVL